MKIGFIGLGIMGKPMALNLKKAVYDLLVFDIVKSSVKVLTDAGAEAADSIKEVAEKADIILTMLPNSPHVKTVIAGENGVLEGISSGKIVIDMSSIAPGVSQEMSKLLQEKGVAFLDAPVSGGEPKAVDGTLAFMVGGPEETFKKVEEILNVMGGSVTLVGDVGSGNVTKLANQIIVALNIAAVSEAMVLATKAGVDPEAVFNAIKGGLAGSTVLNAKMPLILEGNFKPGFRIELHIKDLMNALETAHDVGVPIPLTSSVMEIMQALKVKGHEKDDHGGIIQFYESMADVKVRRK
ncbi:2-hydroxy-3-oxopropionate reductase [Oceanispirochaeta sp.]|jgi:2-hydroxy-3-oxopropionate reductase|uniref:2-hydroxy-3-oxopropionate reductase n=1 Tax=Oceanispirochaeta sp. TaxID=2035350 RepID=UPI002632EDDE|nr:2-hydroxy-3-oxopropionate reductase [Oceanispirochaeta sp.]MDA3955587.1 2-hydroxy-3-oxopropionate reductase [Oceanispirochaeta sp.]